MVAPPVETGGGPLLFGTWGEFDCVAGEAASGAGAAWVGVPACDACEKRGEGGEGGRQESLVRMLMIARNLQDAGPKAANSCRDTVRDPSPLTHLGRRVGRQECLHFCGRRPCAASVRRSLRTNPCAHSHTITLTQSHSRSDTRSLCPALCTAEMAASRRQVRGLILGKAARVIESREAAGEGTCIVLLLGHFPLRLCHLEL